MKIYFEDKDLEELINTGQNRKYRKYARDPEFMRNLRQVYHYFKSLDSATLLGQYGRLNYKKLKHQYSGKSCVRVMHNRVERIIFKELENGIVINILELDNTHYGNKT